MTVLARPRVTQNLQQFITASMHYVYPPEPSKRAMPLDRTRNRPQHVERRRFHSLLDAVCPSRSHDRSLVRLVGCWLAACLPGRLAGWLSHQRVAGVLRIMGQSPPSPRLKAPESWTEVPQSSLNFTPSHCRPEGSESQTKVLLVPDQGSLSSCPDPFDQGPTLDQCRINPEPKSA